MTPARARRCAALTCLILAGWVTVAAAAPPPRLPAACGSLRPQALTFTRATGDSAVLLRWRAPRAARGHRPRAYRV